MKIQPYIIVPNLIEQPTWGGNYIPKLKKISHPKFQNKKIGQSYELYEFSNLSSKLTTKNSPSLELGNPKNPQQSQKIISNDKIFNISQLVKKNPQDVLGEKAIKKHGEKIKILIKFTQAKGNSYQIHAKKRSFNSKWQYKPESWYYFESGVATLGAKPNINWKKFQQTCEIINQQAKDLSHKVQNKKISLTFAKNKLKTFFKTNNPQTFVNLVKVKKNQTIDLSPCGIHHSWEENKKVSPNGNIVYEVQLNVYDQDSTIRCFDKGKIKNDGSIRKLQIKDYFKYIDKSKKANNPQNHLINGRTVFKTSNLKIKQILQNFNYSLQELEFSKLIGNQYTQTTNSYHHLFVKNGGIKLIVDNHHWIITQGYSIFIPANTNQYQLLPINKTATVLKTYLN